MTPSPETGHYHSRLGDEQYLRFGSKYEIQVVIIEPLFEERNFLRRTVVELAGRLAQKGIGSFIPDLPGAGESRVELGTVGVQNWREAVEDASRWLNDTVGRRPHIASLRGGTLFDDAALGQSWWRYAPLAGSDMLRPMRRAGRLMGEDDMLAGYAIPLAMLGELEQANPGAVPGPLRECRVESAGVPLWRRSEPGEDPALAALLADDLAEWVCLCAEH